MLGDQGGAFKLSQRAVKAVLNNQDGFKRSKFDVEKIKQVITKHFYKDGDGINDLLTHSYEQFDKNYFAVLCKKIASLAQESDPLAQHLFRLNGRDLARHINAIYPSVSKVKRHAKIQYDLFKSINQPSIIQKLQEEADGGLTIVCVGSVFKSWPLLQQGKSGQ